jgi:AcrR family transcriptional regulator
VTELAVVVSPVRGRLDQALVDYLATIDEHAFHDVNIEAVAHAAGVSRATAYRHFGDRDGLILRAAIELVRRHSVILRARQSRLPTVAAKIEEAFAYAAVAVHDDKVLGLLLSCDQVDGINRALNEMSVEAMTDTYRAAQIDGQLRSDLTIAEIVAWLAEQRQVVLALGLDADATRTWVRRFVLPAVRPQDVANVSRAEVQAVLDDLTERLDALDDVVQRSSSALS